MLKFIAIIFSFIRAVYILRWLPFCNRCTMRAVPADMTSLHRRRLGRCRRVDFRRPCCAEPGVWTKTRRRRPTVIPSVTVTVSRPRRRRRSSSSSRRQSVSISVLRCSCGTWSRRGLSTPNYPIGSARPSLCLPVTTTSAGTARRSPREFLPSA